MPRITFREDNRSHEAATDDWLYGDSLGKLTQRELRTLAAEKLDPARYRLPCLHSVGTGGVVFGRSAHAATSAAALSSIEVEVESFRRLNLTVCEVRFFVPSAGFTFLKILGEMGRTNQKRLT